MLNSSSNFFTNNSTQNTVKILSTEEKQNFFDEARNIVHKYFHANHIDNTLKGLSNILGTTELETKIRHYEQLLSSWFMIGLFLLNDNIPNKSEDFELSNPGAVDIWQEYGVALFLLTESIDLIGALAHALENKQIASIVSFDANLAKGIHLGLKLINYQFSHMPDFVPSNEVTMVSRPSI